MRKTENNKGKNMSLGTDPILVQFRETEINYTNNEALYSVVIEPTPDDSVDLHALFYFKGVDEPLEFSVARGNLGDPHSIRNIFLKMEDLKNNPGAVIEEHFEKEANQEKNPEIYKLVLDFSDEVVYSDKQNEDETSNNNQEEGENDE